MQGIHEGKRYNFTGQSPISNIVNDYFIITRWMGEHTAVFKTIFLVESKILRISRRVPTPERVQRCLELVEKDPKDVGRTDWAFAKEIVLLDALVAKAPVEEVEVQAVQIGPAVFLANPAEMFCQFSLDLKSQSPFKFTFPVGYANGFVAYVPTEEAFGEHGGGYETRLTSCSNLEVTAGRRIVENSLKLATELTPGEAPTPPSAPPFKGPRPPVPPELE